MYEKVFHLQSYVTEVISDVLYQKHKLVLNIILMKRLEVLHALFCQLLGA